MSGAMMAAMDMTGRATLVAVCVVVLLLAAAACGDDDESPAVEVSGIAGQVLVGPQCPVVMEGSPCPDLPLEATLRVDEVGGGSSQTVETNSDGQFSLLLPPGEYSVVALPVGDGPFPAPPAEQMVTVRPRTFSELTIYYDTGIR
ncbi:MAG: carboxypeptidase-like regulatory domain-containing protein [Dehalococcoidia bacterium]